MFAKFRVSFFVAIAMLGAGMPVQAVDPYGFQFGYTMGYQNSFRNRLPTPPYFSIYPPVYYGKRYERPYGDSPFAAFPQLQSGPGYYPVPKEVPFRTTSVINPHVEHNASREWKESENAIEPVASAPVRPRIGRTIEIINPFAQNKLVHSGK